MKNLFKDVEKEDKKTNISITKENTSIKVVEKILNDFVTIKKGSFTGYERNQEKNK